MKQNGLFTWQIRFEQLDSSGDPLVKLKEIIDFEMFRETLEKARYKDRKSNAGRKPFDAVFMFKIMILQSLYNLSDDQMEFQIRDRISFMRFLDLNLNDTVPDAKTIWLFRETLTNAGVVKQLFNQFDRFLRNNGYAAKQGQIIDASVVAAPKQRNSNDENKLIQKKRVPKTWSKKKRRHKDVEATWYRKNGKNHFGFKNHITIDNENKIIRKYEVTDAALHDSKKFVELIDEENTGKSVWADRAYRSASREEVLKEKGLVSRIIRQGYRAHPLTKRELDLNHKWSKTRCRVEHVFGIQKMQTGDLIVRTIGLARATTKIGLRNLVYNMTRYKTLQFG